MEIESATGTRWGDPLGGVFFALGHRHALRATAAAFLDRAFTSIANDTHIVGPTARVVECKGAIGQESHCSRTSNHRHKILKRDG